MLGLVKVLGGMFVLGGIAAPDVTADKTFPQVDPGIAHLEALLAALATRLHLADLFYMRTGCLFVWHALPPKWMSLLI
jgi:hypothetical protein